MIALQGLMLAESNVTNTSLEGRIGDGEGCIVLSVANGTIVLTSWA